MSAETPKTGGWRGVVVVRHSVALRDESDALVGCSARKIADSGAVLRSRGSKCLAAVQAAARKVKGADVTAGAGFTRKFPAQYNFDQRSGAGQRR
ncbi:hypothetical protein C7G83_07265 [Siccibacter turicensis]|uniref:Uncharacterized protein n=1 Tax=Siccibacter turicensis TaxID=357233 RepID=A0A2P8VKJ5_9ENTR|nr:hypothetical protein C7G83_07265 [Siccibacter turicensis]